MSEDSGDAYETLIQFLYRAPVGLVQTDAEGAVELINPMAAQLLIPLSPDGSLDNLFVALSGVAPQLRDLVQSHGDATTPVCEALRIPLAPDPADHSAPQMLSLSLMQMEATRFMAVLVDATLEVERERRSVARRLNAAARLDSLTQMPNRTGLLEQLQEAAERAKHDAAYHFAVLYLNCDRLSQINDGLGHDVGDEVLGLLAHRLRSTLRSHDRVGRSSEAEHVAARLGGDEFAVMVVLDALAQLDDVHAVAQRMVDLLAQPYGVGPHQVHCSVSMGVVLQPQAVQDAAGILRDASIAMAEAKRAGGGRYIVFEPAMQLRATRGAQMEIDLRQALAQNELFVVYQPVVGLQGPTSTSTGFVDRHAGLEALVRWRHPTRGVVPPYEFIGLAEEIGLIGELGAFVLATACRQFVVWRDSFGIRAPSKLAVNLSRAQVADPSLAARVHDILQAAGMAPAQLQLEVTESLAAQGHDIQSRLHELKSLGLSLALDDFGTGYSSLASLHLLPVDTVKIDRSFVSQADTSPHHRVLIEATIKVAASLGMDTVAEGIETAAQADIVRALGCDKGQGYLFSRPLEADAFERWARES